MGWTTYDLLPPSETRLSNLRHDYARDDGLTAKVWPSHHYWQVVIDYRNVGGFDWMPLPAGKGDEAFRFGLLAEAKAYVEALPRIIVQYGG